MTQPKAKAPGNLQGLERWITEWARDADLQPGPLRRRIGLIAFAAMIEANDELVGVYFSVSPHYDRTLFHMQSDLFQNALHAAIVA